MSNAYLACLADLFIMREPMLGGYIGGVPGTEVYRAGNSCEAAIVAVALDQHGLHNEAVAGYKVSLDIQEPDGNWNDYKGWGHLMLGCLGLQVVGRHGALSPDGRQAVSGRGLSADGRQFAVARAAAGADAARRRPAARSPTA